MVDDPTFSELVQREIHIAKGSIMNTKEFYRVGFYSVPPTMPWPEVVEDGPYASIDFEDYFAAVTFFKGLAYVEAMPIKIQSTHIRGAPFVTLEGHGIEDGLDFEELFDGYKVLEHMHFK